MILYINTSENTQISVGIFTDTGNKLDFKTVPISRNESEVLLVTIDEILKKHKLQKPDGIIVVNSGEGRFSAIRTGIVSANALAFGWGIPVMDIQNANNIQEAVKKISQHKEFTKQVIPKYSREPNLGI